MFSASMVKANEIVIAEMRGHQFYGAECYGTVKTATSLYLALTLSKLFETPRPRHRETVTVAKRWNKSDVGSLPLILRLLSQRRCRTRLVRRAADWHPSYSSTNVKAVDERIDASVRVWETLNRSKAGKAALRKLSAFRNKLLAHILLGPVSKEIPTYAQMQLLLDAARNITESLMFAVNGINLSLTDWEDERLRIASAFWQPALRAARASNE